MEIVILLAEHFSVPNLVIKVYRSYSGAAKGAAKLVNIMLKDSGMRANATTGNWVARLAAIQDKQRGSSQSRCYVDISTTPLL